MGQAALVVGNGKSYEKWLDTVSIPQGRLVLSAAEVKPIPLPGKTHSHGVEGEHSHVGIDPHTWMDPQSYALQAQAVHAGLVGVYPEETAVMDEKLRGLQAQLDALDKQTASLFNSLPPARYSANHPSYNYLFRRYNMEIRSFDVSPTKVPGPKELGKIQAWAQGDLPAVMLWESEPVGEIKAALGGIRHLVVDPIEQPVDGNYDYVSQARANLAAFTELGEGLRGQASGSQQGVGSQ